MSREQISQSTDETSVLQRLMHQLLADSQSYQPRNVDYERFPLPLARRLREQLKDSVLGWLDSRGWLRKPYSPGCPRDCLDFAFRHEQELQALYTRLGDDASREVLLEILRYRILGARHVKLSVNRPKYWEAAARVEKLLRERRTVRTTWDWYLNRYEIEGKFGPIGINCPPSGVLTTFLLEQYDYRGPAEWVGVAPGDCVIDAGACWGDTALYFADRVGAEGAVHSFEFVPENLKILETNLALNPRLCDRIRIHQSALWHRSGEAVSYSENGPGTSVGAAEERSPSNQRTVLTTTIDEFVRAQGIDRVDFIKMDIEGAELPALRGATDTIHRHRPKLALAAYHHAEDVFRLTEFLSEHLPAYRFYLAHYTIHQEESVLYAVADR